MNYPVWDVPASGLLIAFVAIVHVFVSHFAVGGGLFLVLTERKARRDGDADLMAFVRRHTTFFVLLTLVFGAVTGVGIWFTIGLVHPQATSVLINTFVWAWAIEWTFFVAEIAAAMVYHYGWDRLTPRVHEIVGWIYFANAWLSLAVINGILTFMLTPGDWVSTRAFADGFFNPTYWPGVVARTFASVGLAGLYALLTASALEQGAVKERIVRYAAWGWVVPMAVALPLSLAWYLGAAAGVGVPVATVLGAADPSWMSVARSVAGGSDTGYPVAARAAFWSVAAAAGLTIGTLWVVLARARRLGRPTAAGLMALGFVALGGAEWVREDLRKPYVLGELMFVNGVSLPASRAAGEDRFTVGAINASGVRAASVWLRPVPAHLDASRDLAALTEHQGRELFRALCASCHTIDGYLAIRPLVRGKSAASLDGVLAKLALPVDRAGAPAAWDTPGLRLRTWRDRRMPPFAGTAAERTLLAGYLALLGGAAPESLAATVAAPRDGGKAHYEANCAACHASDAMAPFDAKGRQPSELYDLLGRLPDINDMMPAFEGSDAERRALAEYLAGLSAGAEKGGRR